MDQQSKVPPHRLQMSALSLVLNVHPGIGQLSTTSEGLTAVTPASQMRSLSLRNAHGMSHGKEQDPAQLRVTAPSHERHPCWVDKMVMIAMRRGRGSGVTNLFVCRVIALGEKGSGQLLLDVRAQQLRPSSHVLGG